MLLQDGSRPSTCSPSLSFSSASSSSRSSSPSSAKKRALTGETYRPDVDGLRAVAVATVVIYHLNKTCIPGGFVGVDIFFVISGYVVTSSLWHRFHHPIDHAVCSSSYFKDIGDILVGFYARRAKRLMPAAALVIVVVGFLLTILMRPGSTNVDMYYRSAAFALIGWSNMYYITIRQSYFEEGEASLEKNPFTHTWSLGVEEQFYLVFPLLLVVALWPMRSIDHSTRWGVWLAWAWPKSVLGTSAAVSFWASFMLTLKDPQTAFFVLPSRLWELMAGALLFDCQASIAPWHCYLPVAGEVVAERPKKGEVVCGGLQLAAVCAIGCAAAVTPEKVGFPCPWALLAVGGALCFIAAGTNEPRTGINACLGHWLPAYAGKLSYPIYLWHWPTLVLWRFARPGVLGSGWACALYIILVLLLAAGTYHLAEGPFRRWRPGRHWHVLVGWVFVAGAVVLWLFLCQGPMSRAIWEKYAEYLVPVDAAALRNGSNCGDHRCSCNYEIATFHVPGCARVGPGTSRMPQCMRRTVAGQLPVSGATYDWWDDGSCWDLPQGNKPWQIGGRSATKHFNNVSGCLAADRGAQRNKTAMFLVGDSHAGHLVAAVKAAVGDMMSFNFFAKAACFLTAKTQACVKFRGAVYNALKHEIRSGDVVFFSQMFFNDSASTADIAYAARFPKKLATLVASRNASLVLFRDTPSFEAPSHDHGDCMPSLFRPTPEHCTKSLQEVEKRDSRFLKEFETIAAHNIRTYILDHDLMCNGVECGAFVPGTRVLAYSDKHHLTEAASLYLSPFLCSFFGHHGLLPPP